jgi:hypothetical protein
MHFAIAKARHIVRAGYFACRGIEHRWQMTRKALLSSPEQSGYGSSSAVAVAASSNGGARAIDFSGSRLRHVETPFRTPRELAWIVQLSHHDRYARRRTYFL